MEKQSKVLRWGLIFGIVIVLNLFFNYGLSLVYKQPKYEAFCPNTQVITVPGTEKECTDQGGQWTNDPNFSKQPVRVGETPAAGYCNLNYTCGMNFDAANKNYNRNVFAVLVLLGALCVLAGNFFKGNDVVSHSFALGGVLSFIIASMRYWSDANDFIRVIILAIALGVLIWIAIKKFKNKN